ILGVRHSKPLLLLCAVLRSVAGLWHYTPPCYVDDIDVAIFLRTLRPQDLAREIRSGFGMQLLHDPTPVEFDRALTNGQAQGNFLVEQPRQHQIEHLPLAAQESCRMAPQTGAVMRSNRGYHGAPKEFRQTVIAKHGDVRLVSNPPLALPENGDGLNGAPPQGPVPGFAPPQRFLHLLAPGDVYVRANIARKHPVQREPWDTCIHNPP